MNILKKIFRPKIEVVTFTKRQVKERELIISKCKQLAQDCGVEFKIND